MSDASSDVWGDEAPAQLGSKIRRVASASAVALLLAEGVTFVQTIAMARLLSPLEIGIFAAGTVLTVLFGDFADGGLRASLIHRDHDLDDAAETVFWVTLATGLLVTVGAAAVATLLGQLFGSPTAGHVAAATSGLLLVYAAANVPEAILQRQFSVRRRLVIGPLVAITYAVVTVALALAGWGVWSMVVGSYVSQVFRLAALWLMVDWRPFRGRVSWRMWRELARYSSPLLLGLLAYRARQAAETFVVGRGLSPAALGSFRYGQRVARIPMSAIIDVGSNSLFPAFSRLAHDVGRLRSTYSTALHWTMVSASVTSGLLLALGEPAVVTLFGQKWQGAGVALEAMSGIGLGYAMTCVSEELVKGVGRTLLLTWQSVTELVLSVGCLVGLMLWRGFVGAALSLSVASVGLGLVTVVLAQRVVALPGRQLARMLGSPLPPMALATAVAYLLDRTVLTTSTRGTLVAVACLVAATLAYLAVYLVTLVVFAPTTARSVLAKASSLLARLARGRNAREPMPEQEPARVPVPLPTEGAAKEGER